MWFSCRKSVFTTPLPLIAPAKAAAPLSPSPVPTRWSLVSLAHKGSTTASCTTSSSPKLSLLKLSSVTPPNSSKVVSRNLHTGQRSVARLSRRGT